MIWKLTGGQVHATDATNASRTLLFDIRRQEWSAEMGEMLRVPLAMMPEVRDCAGDFGETDAGLFGRAIPIRGVAGDQQAALMGQGCIRPGEMKATYGTGGFMLLNTGETAPLSKARLLTTVAARVEGRTTYALEGSIFIAGAAIQWLAEGLGLAGGPQGAEALAQQAKPGHSVVLVPAFTGLGAPWWDAEARGAIFGLTRDSGRPEIAAAACKTTRIADCLGVVVRRSSKGADAAAAKGVRNSQSRPASLRFFPTTSSRRSVAMNAIARDLPVLVSLQKQATAVRIAKTPSVAANSIRLTPTQGQ